jgi:hypothetical protein
METISGRIDVGHKFMDALMRVIRDGSSDALTFVFSHMQFQGDDEPDDYQMVAVYIVHQDCIAIDFYNQYFKEISNGMHRC